MSEPRIDVSIEHKHAPPANGERPHPNTCPGCGSHYRDDELDANLRICPQCGHHFPVHARERIRQLVDEDSFAEEDGELAGFAMCSRRGGTRTGHVHVLGVRRPWRRRGLGTALLLHSFRGLRARGCARARLMVDGESLTGAVRLYEQAGMHVARRSERWSKELA